MTKLDNLAVAAGWTEQLEDRYSDKKKKKPDEEEPEDDDEKEDESEEDPDQEADANLSELQ